MNCAAESAHDSRRQRALETEWISDRQDALANLQCARVAKRKRDQLLAVRFKLYQGDVVARVRADEPGLEVRLISERHIDALSALHHVVVREDVPACINDETGTRAFNRHGVVEEVVFDCFRNDVCDCGRRLAVDADIFSFERVEAGVTWRSPFGDRIVHRLDRFRNASPPMCPGPVSAENENQSDRDKSNSLTKNWLHIRTLGELNKIVSDDQYSVFKRGALELQSAWRFALIQLTPLPNR